MNEPARTLFSSRQDFQGALRTAFGLAAEQGCRDLWLSDLNFADWPLSESAVIDHLTEWARPHRRLTLLAQDFEMLSRRHPRWVDWRRRWAQVVQCRTSTEVESNQFPTMLLASDLVLVKLNDPRHWRGVISREAPDLVRGHEWIDAVLQRSVEAFPATTLGL